jgi:hypothetical protein
MWWALLIFVFSNIGMHNLKLDLRGNEVAGKASSYPA